MPPICLDTPICLDDFWMPLYIHNTKKACFVRIRGCPYAPIHLDAPCNAQHKESMLCQTKGVFICSHTFGCPLYIHNTKKACFVRLMGCPYAPIHLDAPYVWMPPVCFNATICLDASMFGHPLYVWMPPFLDTPICLDTHLYVWICPCLHSPMFGCPHMFGCPLCLDTNLYGWMPPHLDTPCMFGCPPCLAAPLYVWMLPDLWWHPKVWGTSNIWGVSKHTGASKCMGCIWTPPQSDKVCFLCVVYV